MKNKKFVNSLKKIENQYSELLDSFKSFNLEYKKFKIKKDTRKISFQKEKWKDSEFKLKYNDLEHEFEQIKKSEERCFLSFCADRKVAYEYLSSLGKTSRDSSDIPMAYPNSIINHEKSIESRINTLKSIYTELSNGIVIQGVSVKRNTKNYIKESILALLVPLIAYTIIIDFSLTSRILKIVFILISSYLLSIIFFIKELHEKKLLSVLGMLFSLFGFILALFVF
ncbi:MAG: hypothetical protein JW737_08210 [Acidobacteria bacterium]|nr:hypothetical protein [Acidobacteriota bacterium]